MKPYPNLPAQQWAAQHLIDTFNANEMLWHLLRIARKRRRKVLQRLTKKQHKVLDLLEFSAQRLPDDCVGIPLWRF